MKHAQKVALVPYEEMINTQEKTVENKNMEQNTSLISPVTHTNIQGIPATNTNPVPRDILKDRLTDLDSRMKAILQDSSLSVEEKVIRYNSVLDQYLLFSDKFHNREQRMTNFFPYMEEEEPLRHDTNNANKHIIASLPPSYQKNAEILIKYLQDAGTTWNEEGTVIDNGQEIHGTNISDLIHYVLRHRKRNVPLPSGISNFEKLLESTNLPQSIVPWRKVFDRNKSSSNRSESSSVDQVIQSQHGNGTFEKWVRY